MTRIFKDQRGASAVGVVIVILLLAAVGWFGWKSYQSKSATDSDSQGAYSGWKSYRDSASGVSFKYPATWNVFAYQSKADDVTGKFNLLTVSSVTQQQRSGADAQKYAAIPSLLITTSDADFVEKTVTPANPLYRPLQASERLISDVSMNGETYGLRGYGAKTPDPLIAVEAVICQKDKSCASQIKRGNGGYISAIVASQGNQKTSPAALDINGQDYKNSKLVLESLKF